MSTTNAAAERASERQRAAADPAVSAFVSASAGSGKTKLLVDRLLRLMLGDAAYAGASPARVLCLTYTRTAAAEMRTRLQDTLGAWVGLSETALDGRLLELGVTPSAKLRCRARKLFARVLDPPGGMRIDTIHGFCQSLLRRFPLEAALSPRFRVIEERDAAVALHDARERLVGGALDPAREAAVAHLAGLCRPVDFGRLVADLDLDRVRLAAARALGPALPAAIRRALKVAAVNEAALLAEAVMNCDQVTLIAAAKLPDSAGGRRASKDRMLAWLGQDAATRVRCWGEWRGLFLTNEGEPRKGDQFVDRNNSGAFLAEADRVCAVERARAAVRVAEATIALMTLAGPVLDDVANVKQTSGVLDYADLIGRTAKLLRDPDAGWVLFKLDGGIDHLLLDEVQDTAPEQWRIAHALTTEFFAGEGARPGERTVFAVGDRKQSIFSFQGADPDGFDHWRGRTRERVEAVGHQFLDTTLDVSFRSSGPVLALVDRVFAAEDAAAGVAEPDRPLAHFSARDGHAGRVELWPLAPRPEKRSRRPLDPPDEDAETPAPQRLAERIAAWVATETDGSVMLESKGRPLRPGDVMILVRRRGTFAPALVSALKARGVPVAGLDRMALTKQPAVADLLALCDVLLLPEDDLSLACVLTSPLGGASDDELMALAMGRPGPLIAALRVRADEPAYRHAAAMVAALLARVDYASPHALLVEALGSLGGRARLLARLGEEAADPIDELLASALAFAAEHRPSLQGFLRWLRLSDTEARREPEAAGGLVRVMTVHGAKGLQAPLVILPDTTQAHEPEGRLHWLDDPASGAAVPVWVPRKEFRNDPVDAARARAKDSRTAERNRLLYVAMTRAEDRLLVCGWQTEKEGGGTWYRQVEAGFRSLGAVGAAFDHWEGDHLVHAAPHAAPQVDAPFDAAAATLPMPDWAGAAPLWTPRPPPDEPARPQPLAPSRPEGVELGPVPRAASPIATRDAGGGPFRRGALIHSLLQHLPSLPSAQRAAAAEAWLAAPGQGASAAEARQIAGEIMAILDHRELADVFASGSRAEVPLTGFVEGAVVGGLVDRLAVRPDRVLVVDYKTGRDAPDDVADTPVIYVRQMAAYRAVLRAIYPDRPVTCALVWTRAARVAVLPDALLDAATVT